RYAFIPDPERRALTGTDRQRSRGSSLRNTDYSPPAATSFCAGSAMREEARPFVLSAWASARKSSSFSPAAGERGVEKSSLALHPITHILRTLCPPRPPRHPPPRRSPDHTPPAPPPPPAPPGADPPPAGHPTASSVAPAPTSRRGGPGTS